MMCTVIVTAANNFSSVAHLVVSLTNPRNFSYAITERVTGTAAVDVALVVSNTQGEQDHQLWLQIAVIKIEQRLKSLGIGTETATQNRYSLVEFGGKGNNLTTEFLKVDDQIFFSSASFVHARRQLTRVGDKADGYQAIDYAVKHVPFRNQSNIAKLVLFVSNTKRASVPAFSNITRGNVESLLLRNDDILFNAIVPTNLSMVASDGNLLHTSVIGLTGYNVGIVTAEGYNSYTQGGVPIIRSNELGVVSDYINMTLDAGGFVWSLNTLAQKNITVAQSFIGAMVTEFGLRASRREEVCERCWCNSEGNGSQNRGCETTKKECEIAPDQELCSCLAQRSAVEVSQ